MYSLLHMQHPLVELALTNVDYLYPYQLMIVYQHL